MSDSLQLVTPRQLVEREPWMGAASTRQSEDDRRRRGMRQLRGLLADADRNGLAAAIVRPSDRRILIDLDRWSAWLDSRRAAA